MAAADQVSRRSRMSKVAPMSAPGSTGERQENLDAIVSFAGGGQRRRLFRRLDTLPIKWATGDLPEECRFLLNTHSSSHDDFSRSVKEILQPSRPRCGRSELEPKVVPRPLPSFISSSTTSGSQVHSMSRDRMAGSARGGVAVSLHAHCSSSVATSTPVSR